MQSDVDDDTLRARENAAARDFNWRVSLAQVLVAGGSRHELLLFNLTVVISFN